MQKLTPKPSLQKLRKYSSRAKQQDCFSKLQGFLSQRPFLPEKNNQARLQNTLYQKVTIIRAIKVQNCAIIYWTINDQSYRNQRIIKRWRVYLFFNRIFPFGHIFRSRPATIKELSLKESKCKGNLIADRSKKINTWKY